MIKNIGIKSKKLFQKLLNQYDITIDVTLSTELIPELESLVESIPTKMTEAGIKTFEEELG